MDLPQMAVLDPNDWRGLPWFSPARRPVRRPSSSRELLAEWLASVFCMCVAALAPATAFVATLASLLVLSGFGWILVALARGAGYTFAGLNLWDAALMSFALGLGIGLLS